MWRWIVGVGTLCLLLLIAAGVIIQLNSPDPLDPIIPEVVLKLALGIAMFALPLACYACLDPKSRKPEADDAT